MSSTSWDIGRLFKSAALFPHWQTQHAPSNTHLSLATSCRGSPEASRLASLPAAPSHSCPNQPPAGQSSLHISGCQHPHSSLLGLQWPPVKHGRLNSHVYPPPSLWKPHFVEPKDLKKKKKGRNQWEWNEQERTLQIDGAGWGGGIHKLLEDRKQREKRWVETSFCWLLKGTPLLWGLVDPEASQKGWEGTKCPGRQGWRWALYM